jgi:hypothetical protein
MRIKGDTMRKLTCKVMKNIKKVSFIGLFIYRLIRSKNIRIKEGKLAQ